MIIRLHLIIKLSKFRHDCFNNCTTEYWNNVCCSASMLYFYLMWATQILS